MTEQPRDWDRELADIDRSPAGMCRPLWWSAPGAARAPTPAVPPRRHLIALTWFWVLLAVALAAALLVWPYQHACGLQLIFFLGAAGVTAVIAILAAVASWSHHRGLAHVIALLVLLWAGFIALREVLPRGRALLGCAPPSPPHPPRPLPGRPRRRRVPPPRAHRRQAVRGPRLPTRRLRASRAGFHL